MTLIYDLKCFEDPMKLPGGVWGISRTGFANCRFCKENITKKVSWEICVLGLKIRSADLKLLIHDMLFPLKTTKRWLFGLKEAAFCKFGNR